MTGAGTDGVFVANDAFVEEGVTLGLGTRVWGLAQIRVNATLGRNCIVGRGAYIGSGVSVGDNCKIQNDALIYEPAILADGVFVGPGAVLTNDLFPRAINPDRTLKSPSDWNPVGVMVGEGASIGARAVCVAPVHIGEWSMVAAGAVVTRDVRPFSLVRGVPARHVAWVGRAGKPLVLDEGIYRCPVTGEVFRQVDETLIEIGESRS